MVMGLCLLAGALLTPLITRLTGISDKRLALLVLLGISGLLFVAYWIVGWLTKKSR